MATINLGSIKFKWQGAYAGGTAYTVDDVVSYQGSSYICIQASTGNLPTDTAYFEQMSQAGTNGTDGTDVGTVITTQGDILYRDGSGLQRLGAGTSGQALITNGTGANPSWGTISSAGLIETKIATSSTGYTVSNSSGSWTHLSGWNVPYTPNSADNVLFIHVDVPTSSSYGGGDSGAALEMRVDHAGISETRLYSHNTAQFSGFSGEIGNGSGISFVWKPNTTNQLTFKTYAMDTTGNTSAKFGADVSGIQNYNGSKYFKFTLLEFSGSSGGTYNTGAY